MRSPRSWKLLGTLPLALGLTAALSGCNNTAANLTDAASAPTPILRALSLPAQTRLISSTGMVTPTAAPAGGDALAQPEFPGGPSSGNDPGSADGSAAAGTVVNRSFSRNHPGRPNSVDRAGKPKSNPVVSTTINGLTMRDSRLANGGNQFSLVPPDQALCVGNGFVLESINDALRIHSTSGVDLSGVIDLNTFYGYPAAINRATGRRGPLLTDPVCLYDAATSRWFHVVLTLATNPSTGAYTGANALDLAVSRTADPRGAWTLYHVPVENDGTSTGPGGPAPFIGDYPHIGADANGIYVTTNAYSFFGTDYVGAQLYAFPKAALAAGAGSVNAVHLDLGLRPVPSFTVWPATSPGTQFATDNGGTEYFLSSLAAQEANGTGNASQIAQWSLSNTASLNTATPALSMGVTLVNVAPYSVPGTITQKDPGPGNVPLRDCLNDPTCAPILIGGPDPFHETLPALDGNDSRMQQVSYANGKLWGALDTGILGADGVTPAVGVAWYVLNPSNSQVKLQGYLTAPGNNSVTRPAVAVTESGRGVIGVNLAGPDYYPSAAYASLDAKVGAGAVTVTAAGVGPDDGFSGYKIFGGRQRWGDYAAAAVDGKDIWIANEYTPQTCSLATYLSTSRNCGGTRVTLGNYGTFITKLTP